MRATLDFACFVCAVPAASMAQTSSVAVVQKVTPAGVARAVPRKPLYIPDTDYPREALLKRQEGHTGLNLQIDKASQVRVVQIIASSGFPGLDGQAAQIAKQGSFRPATKDDAPIPSELKVDVTWKMPVSRR